MILTILAIPTILVVIPMKLAMKLLDLEICWDLRWDSNVYISTVNGYKITIWLDLKWDINVYDYISMCSIIWLQVHYASALCWKMCGIVLFGIWYMCGICGLCVCYMCGICGLCVWYMWSLSVVYVWLFGFTCLMPEPHAEKQWSLMGH